MRNLKRNERKMWYALFVDEIPVYDDEGNPTFETRPGFSNPVQFKANLSAGNSNADEEPFGNDVVYDRIILTHDLSLPIDEHSLLWVKKEPTYIGLIVDPESADYEVAAAPIDSLNVLQIAIRRRVGNHIKSEPVNGFGTEGD